ncbi:hypothetical protein CEQ90_17975 [Lewinellaceae bacterium SD302]|nr:hypothetical protein CEQ90_17975 [Lewinellaceae bacterium SD302]
MLRSLLTYLLFFFAALTGLFAQQLEVINEEPYSPEELIENVFLGEGIEVIDVNYQGDERSTAYFRHGAVSIGLDRGIIMTTGITVPQGTQPGVAGNGEDYFSTNINSPVLEDPDLLAIVDDPGTPVHDITSYVISFRPLGDSVSFRYVFASEEYPEYVCSQYNDLFGFFISGPGISGPFENGAINLARIPGTDLPVRINTVNPGESGSNGSVINCETPNGSLDHSEFYVGNTGSLQQPVFDGLTTVFTAATAVEACEVYTIKIIIADVGDAVLDSGVFLEARSFGGESTNLEIVNLAIDGGMAEGCRPAELHFYTSSPVTADYPLTVDFFGDATPGLDYTQPPLELTIPAGDSLLVIPLAAFEDNLPDPEEEILISLLRSACFTDTFRIRIEENRLDSILLQDQFSVCGGEVLDLQAEVVGAEPEIFSFSNPEDVNLSYSLTNPWRSSFIDVSGVVPEIMSELVLESVCIDELQHNRPAQVDVFLFNPNGVPLELTTDNGGDGGNAAFEGYLNTCFTPAATNPITGPGNEAPASMVPFTGEWQPEGELDELWFGGNQPTNGSWELRVRDDALFTNGTLSEWSISFRRPYAIEYAWDQDADLTCYNCPDPQLTVTSEGFVGLTVSDIYGCTLSDSVEIVFEDVAPLAFAPACVEGTDSSLLFNWGNAAGVTYYEVRIDDGNWINVGLDTSYLLNGLAADSSYSLVIRPVFNNCAGPEESASCQTYSCDEDRPTIELLNATDPLCAGGADGALAVTGNGLYGPFTYRVDAQNNLDGVFSNLGTGNYLAIIRDQRGCTDSLTVSLDEPAPLENELEVEGQIGCSTTAAIAATTTGGTGTYTFSWNGVPGQATLDEISNAGQYVLLITDANGCTLSDSVALTAPGTVSFVSEVTAAACTGVNNGSISLAPSGGVGPYSFTWSDTPGLDLATRTELPAGIYEVTVTDQTGCMVTQSISVGSGLEVEIRGTSKVARCYGSMDAEILTTIDNASGAIIYQWSEPGLNGPNPTGLDAGTYGLTVTDDRGCRADTTFVTSEPDELIVANLLGENPNCPGDQNGSVTVSLTGGTQPYAFNWNNGGAAAIITGLTAGSYALTATDLNGCELETSVMLDEPAPPLIEASTQDVSCAGDNSGSALLTSTATLVANYYWPQLNAEGAEQEDLPAGTYTVVVTSENGCLSETSVTIEEPPLLEMDAIAEPVGCFGESNGFIELPVEGGVPPYQFRLNQAEWGTENVFLGLQPGLYRAAVLDANGCTVEMSELGVAEPGPFAIDLGPTINLRYGDSLMLEVSSTGGTLPMSVYQWTATDSSALSCQDCPTPWLSPTEQTTVYLQALDRSGCLARSLVNVIVEKDFPVQVPTGFTPNNDGENDRLIVHGLPGIEIANFQLFDRWGELVFEQHDFPVNSDMHGWDGTVRGEEMNGQVFVWQLEAVFPDGKTRRFHGQSALIR